MIVEAFKMVSSIFPFIKEAFLWRDGAEVGKPITEQNLIRRKIAVFVLIASLVVNYLVVDKLYEYYKENKRLAAVNAELVKTNEDDAKQLSKYANLEAQCVKSEKVFELINKQIAEEIDQGLLIRPSQCPSTAGASQRTKKK